MHFQSFKAFLANVVFYPYTHLTQALSRSRLGFIRLVTRLTMALFGQVRDQVIQVKDQIGQGWGQELDMNISLEVKTLISF